MIPADRLVQLLADPDSGLAITPLVDLGQVGPGHIDLRLGPDIIVSKRAVGAVLLDPVDPAAFRQAREDRHSYVRRALGDSFHLQPGEFAIARSLEYVAMPPNMSAEVLGRSSWGRLGLIIATATLVQPGFGGTITLELTNVANTPIVLHVGTRVAQLSFTAEALPSGVLGSLAAWNARRKQRPTLDECRRVLARHRSGRSSSGGRYVDQLKPELSRIERDPDLAWVAPSAVRYIVGVLGHRYAGKSRTIDFLVAERGFRLYRFMHLLREEAQRRGQNPEDTTVLRNLGNDLRSDHGDDVLARLLWHRIRRDLLDAEQRTSPVRVVVEGFKLAAEVYAFGHLATFRPLIVDASPLVRVARAAEEPKALEPDTPLPPEEEVDRVRWLREHVDEPHDLRHPLGPVIDVAGQWSGTLRAANEGDWADAKALLDRHRRWLDAQWRAGSLEPAPGLATALAGNVQPPVRDQDR